MGYCVIHKEYGGGGCPKCFPPDDCPSCTALRDKLKECEGVGLQRGLEIDTLRAEVERLKMLLDARDTEYFTSRRMAKEG